MATAFDSQVSSFFIDGSTGTLVDVSDNIVSIDGLPGKRDLSDITTFGSGGHRWYPSLENAEFSVEAIYNQDATTGTDTVFGVMRTATTTRSFSYYPTATTSTLYAGECWIDDYNIVGRVGSHIVARIHCKVDNTVARTPST